VDVVFRHACKLGTLLGGATITSPWAASAQQRAIPLVGLLSGADPAGYSAQLEGLRLGLLDHGLVEGQTIRIEYRWAESKYDRLPALAADLVSRGVEIIITQGTPAALAAKRATSTTPIVMAVVGNPIETGIVASVARPGGNITGSSVFYDEINAKRVELLKDLMPAACACGSVGQMRVLAIANPRRIAELAIKNRLPSIGFREYCQAGGLAAYGVDFPQIWRSAGVFV
jgi:putative ABC transport system substrate-binding protein